MMGKKNYKKTFTLNIIGGIIIIGIAFYIMLFKKEELKPDAYTVSLVALYIAGVLTIVSNVLLFRYISKNEKKL